MDFYSKFDKKASSQKLVKVGRITSLVVLIIAIIWAPFIQNFDSLVSYYQEIVSYLAPPVVGTFFLGLFWKRSNAQGAIAGLFSGLFIAISIMIIKYIIGIEIGLHFLILAPVVLAISALVNVLVSLLTAIPDQEQVNANTWTRKIWIEETKELEGLVWYKNFRVLSVLLIIACFLMYLLFY